VGAWIRLSTTQDTVHARRGWRSDMHGRRNRILLRPHLPCQTRMLQPHARIDRSLLFCRSCGPKLHTNHRFFLAATRSSYYHLPTRPSQIIRKCLHRSIRLPRRMLDRPRQLVSGPPQLVRVVQSVTPLPIVAAASTAHIYTQWLSSPCHPSTRPRRAIRPHPLCLAPMAIPRSAHPAQRHHLTSPITATTFTAPPPPRRDQEGRWSSVLLRLGVRWAVVLGVPDPTFLATAVQVFQTFWTYVSSVSFGCCKSRSEILYMLQ
jgi:hypothetical protein